MCLFERVVQCTSGDDTDTIGPYLHRIAKKSNSKKEQKSFAERRTKNVNREK